MKVHLLVETAPAGHCLFNARSPRTRDWKQMDRFSPRQRSRVMSLIGGRDTAPELLIRSLVHRLGYRFRLHRKDLPGTPDLVFTRRRRVIFVHGCFWHGHDCPRGRMPSSNVAFWERKIGRNKERDALAQQRLRDDGWKIFVVWQCETKCHDELQKTLVEFLGGELAT
jgi:DNA mismatch endonuclease (patch repair protein)